MSNKKSNEELQNRREFFKKAAKTALPVIGAVVLASTPFSNAFATEENGCQWGCQGSCWSSCQSSCRGTCAEGCTGSCQTGCKAACANNCNANAGGWY